MNDVVIHQLWYDLDQEPREGLWGLLLRQRRNFLSDKCTVLSSRSLCRKYALLSRHNGDTRLQRS